MNTTATYPNRLQDKEKLEKLISLNEIGNSTTEFYIANDLLAVGYTRIVYGDHGPYIEFEKKNFVLDLKSKFGNDNLDNLPGLDFKYYYYWLYPIGHSNLKVYLQIKPVHDLPNAPRRLDGLKSSFNRKEGYADYKRGFYYINPYDLIIK